MMEKAGEGKEGRTHGEREARTQTDTLALTRKKGGNDGDGGGRGATVGVWQRLAERGGESGQ